MRLYRYVIILVLVTVLNVLLGADRRPEGSGRVRGTFSKQAVRSGS